MKHLRSLAFVSLAAATLVGCKKRREADLSPPVSRATTGPTANYSPFAEKRKPMPPAIKTPTGLFECNQGERAKLTKAAAKVLPFKLESCPTIPSVMGTLTWGMDFDTALKAANASKTEQAPKTVTINGVPMMVMNLAFMNGMHGSLMVGKSQYNIRFNTLGRANEISFVANQAGVDAMTTAWGAPLKIEREDEPVSIWFNPAQYTRVEVKEVSDDTYDVRYFGYMPISKLLAVDGILSKAIIGEDFTKVEEMVSDIIDVDSKTVEVGKSALALLNDKNGTLAAHSSIQPNAELVLLGTATTSHFDLSLSFGENKLESWGGLLDPMKNPAITAEYAAEFAEALGPATDESTLESDGPRYVFNAPNGYKVTLNRSEPLDYWFFSVSK